MLFGRRSNPTVDYRAMHDCAGCKGGVQAEAGTEEEAPTLSISTRYAKTNFLGRVMLEVLVKTRYTGRSNVSPRLVHRGMACSLPVFPERKMFIQNFGMATWPLRLPIKKALRRALEAGARGVLIDARNETPPREMSQSAQREFQHYLAELGLTLTGFCFPTRHALHDSRNLDQRLSAIKQSMQFCASMKTRVLLVDVGTLPPLNEKTQAELKLLTDVLTDLATQGNYLGVTVCITPAGGDLAQLRELLDQIQSGPIGINLDPATSLFNDQNPTDIVRQFHDRLQHVTARDATRSRDGVGQETAIGRGEVAWEEVLAVLAEAEYSGWVTVQRTSGEKPGIDMENGIKYLQNIWLD
ncbi:MAG: sugar phosphate isomerase/epimerase [Planctomycetaceae bacterium]|nr:sugar phosphate isomerase/epimerase [Planctomycetaceae bacterium]